MGATPEKTGEKAAAADSAVAKKPPRDLESKVWLAVVLIPILIYIVGWLPGRRNTEIQRYHQEMIDFEAGALEILKANLDVLVATVSNGSQVTASESKGDPLLDSRIPFVDLPGESERGDISFSIRASKGVAIAPYTPCSLNWTSAPNQLKLDFSFEKTLINTAQPTDPPQDYRLRLQGEIDLRDSLERVAKSTSFDALLVADSDGHLLLRHGRKAHLFSTSLNFIAAEEAWKASLAIDPKKASVLPDFFLIDSSSIEKEVAGTSFTLFPREISLDVTNLARRGQRWQECFPISGTSDCKKSDNPRSKQLRAIGLVANSRLTAASLRPPEAIYWPAVWTYLAIFFFLTLRLFVSQTNKRRLYRNLAIAGLGLSLGTLVGFAAVYPHFLTWQDRTLGELSRSLAKNADKEVSLALEVLRSPASALWQPRTNVPKSAKEIDSALSSYPFELRYILLDKQTAEVLNYGDSQAKQLKSISFVDREFYKEAGKLAVPEPAKGASGQTVEFSEPVIESLTSRHNGRKATVISVATKGQIRALVTELNSLQRMSVANGFGFAVIGMDDPAQPWRVLYHSDPLHRNDEDFLADFSNASCLRFGVRKEEGDFCTGFLHGDSVRAFVQERATGFFSHLIGARRFAIITFSRNEIVDTALLGSMLSLIRLSVLLLIFWTVWQLLYPPPQSNTARRLRTYCAFFLFACFGFWIAWIIEARIYQETSDKAEWEAFEAHYERSSATKPRDVAISLMYAGSPISAWPAKAGDSRDGTEASAWGWRGLYRSLRPSASRFENTSIPLYTTIDGPFGSAWSFNLLSGPWSGRTWSWLVFLIVVIVISGILFQGFSKNRLWLKLAGKPDKTEADDAEGYSNLATAVAICAAILVITLWNQELIAAMIAALGMLDKVGAGFTGLLRWGRNK